MSRIPTTAIVLLAAATWAFAEDGDFQPLLNGKDLSGWIPVNTAPSTWSVQDGMLICSGKPIGEMRTNRMYQNFVLELEWRHMVPRGNAGVFVWADDITARGVPFHRSIEVQVLENAYGNDQSHTTHGDIFPIHGSTMTPINGRGGSRAFPTEFRSKPSPEWNHYRIECRDGEISLAVNGKVVTRGTECIPRKGYICLESEGGIVHYRNVRIKELPDSPIEADQVAIEDRGFRCLYNGIDLDGWRADGDGWQPTDWELKFTGDPFGTLSTAEEFGDLAFIVDVRLNEANASATIATQGMVIPIFRRDHRLGNVDPKNWIVVDGKNWNRIEGQLRGGSLTLTVNGGGVQSWDVETIRRGPLQIRAVGPINLANIYVRTIAEE